ncbi:hypothetical protein [Kitasatospora sp. NPDC057223]|uniref:hypothetical protein n=1 Tax=Kitasatospora sp. NPDC057223 TaxID=3346055 RepID=UPI003644E8D0
MSEGDDGAAEIGRPLHAESLCILDAVICVHFVGAGLHRLLIDVLRRAGLTLLVPQEVCDEVAGKSRKYPQITNPWNRLTASTVVRVLPPLLAVDAPARVIEVLEDIRGFQAEQALRKRKDLGEAVVVAHGVHFQEQGHEVYVAIDDQGGKAIATQHNLTVLTIEDVIELAIAFGHFPNEGDLKTAYRKLRGYGDGLPSYDCTDLHGSYTKWRAASQAADAP